MGTGHLESGAEKRWERRKEARPEEIVAAALECFAERGFAGTRVDDVATRAGVTKGTVYLYFANKEELFKAVVRQSLLPILHRAMSDLPTDVDDPRERIRRIFGFFVRDVLNSPLAAIPKLVIAEAENFPEIAKFYLEEVVGRGRSFFSEAIRQGIERGQFRPVDPEHTFYSLVAPVLLAALWQRSLGPYDERPLDSEAMIREHLDLIFRGLSPDPPVPNQKARLS